MHLKFNLSFLRLLLKLAFLFYLFFIISVYLINLVYFKMSKEIENDSFQSFNAKYNLNFNTLSHNIVFNETVYKNVKNFNKCRGCRYSVVLFCFNKSSLSKRYLLDFFKFLMVDLSVFSVDQFNVLHFLHYLRNNFFIKNRIILMVFEDYAIYMNLKKQQRISLNQYCKEKNIGIIAFFSDGEAFSTEPSSIMKVLYNKLNYCIGFVICYC